MRANHKGFALYEILLLLAIASTVGFVGWFVLSSNKSASNTLDQLADIASSGKASSKYSKIVAVGDIACDPTDRHFSGTDPSFCQSATTNALLALLKPEAVLSLGDLQYNDGTLSKFMDSYHQDWGKDKAKTYPVPGNHEYGTDEASGYFDYFADGQAGEKGKGYYSFDIGGWHLVALNSNCGDIGGCDQSSPQYEWLMKDLLSNKSACTLAFWHHPRFTSGRYNGDNNTTSRSAPFWDLLYQDRADVILNGHDHLYERFALQRPDAGADSLGIRQFTVGTGGKALYKRSAVKENSQSLIDDRFGVLAIDLLAKAYRWQFVATSGEVLDSGYQQCSL